MKTKKELGYKYYNLLSDIISYTNDSQDIHFTLEKVLEVSPKVWKNSKKGVFFFRSLYLVVS